MQSDNEEVFLNKILSIKLIVGCVNTQRLEIIDFQPLAIPCIILKQYF